MTPERKQKINNVTSARQEGVIVLEDIHDPHNAQAIFRSCDAFGFQKVYLIFENQKPFNPKKIGKLSSSSANKWIDFEIFDSTEKCLQKLKDNGYKIIATALTDDAIDLNQSDFKERKLALMLGNEHRGLSESALKMADQIIKIPMKGMVQSFNLSVTASIFLFEINRQREIKDASNFLLTKNEQESLFEDFMKR